MLSSTYVSHSLDIIIYRELEIVYVYLMPHVIVYLSTEISQTVWNFFTMHWLCLYTKGFSLGMKGSEIMLYIICMQQLIIPLKFSFWLQYIVCIIYSRYCRYSNPRLCIISEMRLYNSYHLSSFSTSHFSLNTITFDLFYYDYILPANYIPGISNYVIIWNWFSTWRNYHTQGLYSEGINTG